MHTSNDDFMNKLQRDWQGAKREVFRDALRRCYTENRTLAECAELIKAALEDGLAGDLRVVDLLPKATDNVVSSAPTAGLRVAPLPTAAHHRPHATPVASHLAAPKRAGRTRLRRSAQEQAALESAVFERIAGNHAPVGPNHLVQVLAPHFSRVDEGVMRLVLRKLAKAGRIQRHPTHRTLWMYRPQGAMAP